MIIVQELIEKLSEFNPDTKVSISRIYEHNEYNELRKSIYSDFDTPDIKQNDDLNIVEIIIPEYPNDEFIVQ